jgi:hypothetical protein
VLPLCGIRADLDADRERARDASLWLGSRRCGQSDASMRPSKRIEIVRNPNWDRTTDYRPAYLDAVTIQEGNIQRQHRHRAAARRRLAGDRHARALVRGLPRHPLALGGLPLVRREAGAHRVMRDHFPS